MVMVQRIFHLGYQIDKVIKIKNGQVDDILIQKNPKLVKDIDW